ncbi:TonB-dependent receptor-like protein [Sphingobium sp. SYK-6]|uniref:TonB-dependent receptor n=1 Tax=Sphingobium sp. (strain NBRC 103272 / SYK-6) TaxID=627192 RepID=UPI0002276C50|nr:TonB-dependent receptor [Sphingobium sp. SYK-6]BAK64911.1 TonB-dependent receptor-like protein [Sphingobium sp. SYK-6]
MKKFSNQTLLKVAAAPAVLGLALLSTAANAQEPQGADDAETGDVIIITGSLIKNPNLQGSTPVNVTTADEIDLLQSNVAEEMLREIPGIVPSIGSAVNNGNGGNSFVNLRGLGSNRNVVLLDGVRIVPADLVGRVDLNNIPLALIERVDVLTGGASTTYGADAISGVVNFVTKQDFTGLEATAASQITERGDGKTYRFDVTTGVSFDDGRGNIVLSVGYQHADPVYQGQRKIGMNTIGSYTGASAGSGTAVPTRFSVPGSGTLQIAPDGQSLVGTYAPFNFAPDNIFQTPFERYNIYSAARYEVADGIEVYSRGLFTKNTVDTIIAPSGAFGIAVDIPLSNPYLPTGIRNQFCSAFDISGADCAAAATATDPSDPAYREVTTAMFRRAVEVGPRISEYSNTVFDYRLGLRAGVTDSIDFDVYGAYGEAEQVQTIMGYTLNSRVRESLLATNTTTCLDGTRSDCVPVNWFGATPGGFTSEQIDFLTGESTVRVKTSLTQAHATLSGDFGVASPLAADPISFAVAGEYRKYTAQQASDTLAESGDLGGSGGPAPNIRGAFDVYEAIGELVVPVVTDKPFFEELTIQAGIRYSSYTIDAVGTPSFDTTTWKVQGTWTPTPGFTLRGGYSRAVRAPNINELFAPVSTGLTSLSSDPCASINDEGVRISPGPTGVLRDVCLAQGATPANVDSINVPIASQANQTSGGNINLKPETSNSYTIGAIFQPAVLSGFSATIDYYNIKLTGAISTPTPGDAMDACFAGSNLSPTNPACTVIRRDPLTGGLNGDPTTTPGLFLASSNLGELATDGIDLTMNYRHQLGFADLALNFVGNWTNKSTFKSSPSAVALDCVGLVSANCGSLQPELQWSLRTTLAFSGFDVSFLWRHIDSFVHEDAPDLFVGVPFGYTESFDFNRIKAYDYFDLTARFNIMENLSLTFTVQNLFDKDPPLVGSDAGGTAWNSGNTFPSTYDALGRRYGAQVKLRF